MRNVILFRTIENATSTQNYQTKEIRISTHYPDNNSDILTVNIKNIFFYRGNDIINKIFQKALHISKLNVKLYQFQLAGNNLFYILSHIVLLKNKCIVSSSSIHIGHKLKSHFTSNFFYLYYRSCNIESTLLLEILPKNIMGSTYIVYIFMWLQNA